MAVKRTILKMKSVIENWKFDTKKIKNIQNNPKGVNKAYGMSVEIKEDSKWETSWYELIY